MTWDIILESQNSNWERKSFVGLGCQILCMGGAKYSYPICGRVPRQYRVNESVALHSWRPVASQYIQTHKLHLASGS